MNAPFPNPPPPATRQPILNLPVAVAGLIGVLVAIHALRVLVLSAGADMQVIFDYAFISVREFHPEASVGRAASGARVWTFLTYAFLHADWSHVLINSVWLAAFGAPLAWRFGTTRFLLFSAAGAVAGAALHLAIFPDFDRVYDRRVGRRLGSDGGCGALRLPGGRAHGAPLCRR